MSERSSGPHASISTSELSIVSDPWLATIMARDVHRVTGVWTVRQEHDTLREIRRLLSRPGFVFARIATHEVGTSHRLEECGLRLVDTALTLEAQPLPSVKTVGGRVRFAVSADEATVLDIARHSFRYSRFHLDPDIPRSLADEVKAQWARNFFSRQRGDYMVIAEHEGRVVGFLQAISAADQALCIDLIAVHPDHRGLGLAGEMIRFASRECERPRALRVGTQSANIPSLMLYHKLGFRVAASHHVFHSHGPL
ncbi:MAG: GNAT family N-acetyltransferase [Nitrospira sp.]|jgi:ribosomal protein S18 acetylase RimI-like enzyme|nr:GNAT family N-acetyltransferase [Nitrospira sp.]HQY58617.1 GNAT family N-acetyltransferase [Nitrospira sp.]HRA95493.1 GNAT family N-acetyltransferase [Nitrospira sp.]